MSLLHRHKHLPWVGFITLILATSLSAESKQTPSNQHTATDITKQQRGFPGDIPAYKEVSSIAGIDHQYSGPWEYFVGGGLAVFDCNGDRLPDLYIAGGDQTAKLYVNQSSGAISAGQSGLKFEQLESPVTDLKRVTGAYPIDIDSDGQLDLVVLRVGENRVLKGGPDCTFKPANAAWNIDGGHAWTTAFSATFESENTLPTLAFGNYVDRSAPGSPWGTCHDNVLFRPDKEATDDQYQEALALTPGHCALSLLFTDWNRSGQDDLRITNDRHYYRGGEEQLWRFDSGRYPRLYGRSDGWQSLVIWGMGIAETDINADGFPEYALTSMGDTKLQQLDLLAATETSQPVYDDVAYNLGVTAHRPYTGGDIRPSTGWHAEFADVNNDARQDLFIAKGNVERMPDFADIDPDNLLLATADGQYIEQGDNAGVALPRKGRGAAAVDLNADGQLELIVVNRGSPVSLFEHTGMHSPTGTRQGGNWLKLEVRQPGINTQAIGARLSVKTGNHVQTRRVRIGGGHASGQLGFVHLGLGVAERATVRVQWPDGEWSAPYRLFANQHAVITRNDPNVIYWYPRPTNQEH